MIVLSRARFRARATPLRQAPSDVNIPILRGGIARECPL